ncbi:Succinate dehydrogenase assembly factor 3, mitochondrial [Frankliniella fusca]|uniref:Succinate dehydrogenase assembly factor 3 n=1 Tax=Frankliniella fusca TaxID=407009 RepID=A0AAE1HEV3_9NEOP|nr:Succinate dehydrogenase assembly factor 3, mitochondrial [Frankliniella fusca]
MAQTHVQRVRLLYKTILKLHRGLPAELQALGNSYIRDEFKRHKGCNTSEANVFMNEWTKYALDLSEQLGLRGPKTGREIGDNLDEDALNLLRDEQIAQLYELHLAATAPRKQQ